MYDDQPRLWSGLLDTHTETLLDHRQMTDNVDLVDQLIAERDPADLVFLYLDYVVMYRVDRDTQWFQGCLPLLQAAHEEIKRRKGELDSDEVKEEE